jgi:hypothetical protein
MTPHVSDLRYLMKKGDVSHSDAYHALSISDNLEEAIEVLGLDVTPRILGLKTNQIVKFTDMFGSSKIGKVIATSSTKKIIYVEVKHINSNYKLLPGSIVIEFQEEEPKLVDYLNKQVHIVHPIIFDVNFTIVPATKAEKKQYYKIKKERFKKWLNQEFPR